MNFNLNLIAKNGTKNEIQKIIETIKLTYEENEENENYIQKIINLKNEQKYSPLHISIFARYFTSLHFLFFFLSSFSSHFTSNFFSLLFKKRNLETFTALIEFGSDINSKCHGTPPLHLSIVMTTLPGGYEFGITCALKLIAEGCDLNAKVL